MNKPSKLGVIRGRFDLIHPGHISFFENAKQIVDTLYVFIDSDEFIENTGGKPTVNDELYRRLCLENQKQIDGVWIFTDEKHFYRLCESFSAGHSYECYYFKGGDYAPRDLPEAASLRCFGYTIISLDYDSNYSTTDLKKRIVDEALKKQVQLEMDYK
jgi:cytidyltransferase-like protein